MVLKSCRRSDSLFKNSVQNAIGKPGKSKRLDAIQAQLKSCRGF